MVNLQTYHLIPPPHFQLTESDLEPYKNFPLVVSERWQLEIAETVFDVVNQEADRVENKRRSKQQQSASCAANSSAVPSSSNQKACTSSTASEASSGEIPGGVDPFSASQFNSDCIVDGDVLKLVGPFFQTWQRKFLRLFPNRLELYCKSRDGTILKKGAEVCHIYRQYPTILLFPLLLLLFSFLVNFYG